MLYDNALLASTYLHAWVVTGEERYRSVVEETIGYLLREMRLESGGFASAQDADTDGVEGLTYTWTSAEWQELGLDPSLLEPFEHGRAIVRGALDDAAKARLLAIRDERPQPFRDDKAIAAWNGLTLAALAEAARRLDRGDWLSAAEELGAFLLGPLRGEDGRVLRSIRDGRVSGPGFLDDHANVAHGLLELHVASGDPRWLLEARRIADLAVELFADDERGGFFLAPHDGEALATRAKDLDDDPTPSGNAMLASVLVRLGRSGGTTVSSNGERASCGCSPRRWSACPAPSRGRSARSTSIYRRRVSWRSSATSAPRSPARRSHPSSPRRSSPSAPPRGATAGRQDARGRPTNRLRLRALRVPRTRHARGRAQ